MTTVVNIANSRVMQSILSDIADYPNSTAKEIFTRISARRLCTIESYMTQLVRAGFAHVSGWSIGEHPSGNASISSRYSIGKGVTPPRPEGKELSPVRQIVVRKSKTPFVIPRDYMLCALMGIAA